MTYLTVKPRPRSIDSFDRFFNQMVKNSFALPVAPQAAPLAVDVQANDNGYVLTANVPGFTAEDISIEILENVISLSAKVESSEDSESDGYVLRERRHSSFRRKLRLPKEIDSEAVEASIENGVLTLSLPVVEDAKPKSISVSVK